MKSSVLDFFFPQNNSVAKMPGAGGGVAAAPTGTSVQGPGFKLCFRQTGTHGRRRRVGTS